MFFKRVLSLVGRGHTSYLISGIGLAGLTAASVTNAGDGTDNKSRLELARIACSEYKLVSTSSGPQVSNLDRMIIFGGQSHPKFTNNLATRLGVEVRLLLVFTTFTFSF